MNFACDFAIRSLPEDTKMVATKPRRVLIATQNTGKVREIRRMLLHVSAEFVGLDQMEPVAAPKEDGTTFLENAVIKARYYGGRFGDIALADDSGLVVDALNGSPGVHSARYGGDGLTDADRTDLLLRELREVPAGKRTARFVCAVVVYDPSKGGKLLHASGTVEGSITREPRGTDGFGYDPVFVPIGETRTTAEMSAEEKDELSHRGRAIRAIEPVLQTHLRCV